MDFLKEIFKFFTAKEYSFASKFISLILVFSIIFLIDNLLGFSFYYSTNQKINQLETIANLKKDCSENKELLKMLTETEAEIINKKNIIEGFLDLFSKGAFDERKIIKEQVIDSIYQIHYDTIIVYKKQDLPSWSRNFDDTLDFKIPNRNQLKPNWNISDNGINEAIIDTIEEHSIKENEKEQPAVIIKSRSKLWHTLTSSYGLILILIILPIVPFTEKKFDWSMMMGMIFFMVIDAGLIWFNQYLLGLIPVILNKPWINYSINILIQTIVSVFIFSALIKQGNKNNKNVT